MIGATAGDTFLVKPLKADTDLYVTALDVVITDGGAEAREFGNFPALTNGCTIQWVTQDFGTIVLADELKANWDFIRYCRGKPAFGTGNNSFRIPNVVDASEAYLFSIDFDEIYGLQWGLRLRANTEDRLEIVINDTIPNVDQFDAVAAGIEF